jgi:UDPglucose 6-dehydrogenase
MEIIIAGYGFVGKAVAHAIENKNIIHIVDPKVNYSVVSDYKYGEGVIICVGTPSNQFGDCDISQVTSVMDTVPVHVPVLIKCTIPPDYLEKILKLYPDHSICYSPEFLRAATANEDFKNQENMILGGHDPFEIWSTLFRTSLPKLKTIFYCTIAEASMTKYATNTFLSVKVIFFNQLFDMCRANNIDFDTVTSLLKLDDRIGTSHMQVPGSDGSRGFGGACFPKDTDAFVHFADRFTMSHTLVESAIKYNKKIRKTLT